MRRYTFRGFKYGDSDCPMARLQALEDKIEDGLLIEAPCKIGEKFYSVLSEFKECEAIKNGLFCHKKEGAKYVLFNKKVLKARFEEVYKKIKSFNFTPKWDNFYDLKGNKEWWVICFPELMSVDNKTAWSKIPPEMVEYIKSLPEYNEKIFKAITE